MPAENMQNESFSPDEPFGCHPPWQTPINPKSLAKLDRLLASDWELPPELFSLPPITDRYWAEHVLAALARHGRLDQADKLRVEWGYPDSVDRCQGSTGVSVRVLMSCCS